MSGDRLALVPSWVLFLPEPEQDYVLALVEIAKAARRVEAAFAAEPHDPNELWNASGPLRSALARLDSGEGK